MVDSTDVGELNCQEIVSEPAPQELVAVLFHPVHTYIDQVYVVRVLSGIGEVSGRDVIRLRAEKQGLLTNGHDDDYT